MRTTLSLFLFFTAVLVLTGITRPWPETDLDIWPVVAVDTACTSDFCNCPEASAALLCEDFEEGATDCAVAEAFGTLNLAGEIGYVEGVPDCADATSPLDGTYSFEADDNTVTDSTSWWPVDVAGTTNICESTAGCILTTLINVADDDGTDAVTIITMGDVCNAKMAGSTDNFTVNCAAGGSAAASYTNDVTYKLCLKYTLDDDCTLALDPVGGTYCEGTIDSTTRLNCNGGAHQAIGYIGFGDATDHASIEMDNVLIVNE